MLVGCICGGLLEQLTAILASVDLTALTALAHGWLERFLGGVGITRG